jgi:O-methyltransferase involved in polyketide biosynthesis
MKLKTGTLAAVEADLTDLEAVLAHPDVRAVLDFARPVGIILGAILHFRPAEVAAELCARYMSRAAPGSWLIVSTGHYEDKKVAARVQETGTYARFWNHDAAAVATWLTGLETVPPGICEASRWIAATGGVPSAWSTYTLAAAAVKTV